MNMNHNLWCFLAPFKLCFGYFFASSIKLLVNLKTLIVNFFVKEKGKIKKKFLIKKKNYIYNTSECQTLELFSILQLVGKKVCLQISPFSFLFLWKEHNQFFVCVCVGGWASKREGEWECAWYALLFVSSCFFTVFSRENRFWALLGICPQNSRKFQVSVHRRKGDKRRWDSTVLQGKHFPQNHQRLHVSRRWYYKHEWNWWLFNLWT